MLTIARRVWGALLILALAGMVSACGSSDASESAPRRTVFQVSTLGALVRGLYDGELPIEDLADHGNFGLGTFASVDGEMVVLDGVVYQVRIDGVPQVANATDTTPFAAVTEFVGDETFDLDGATDYADLQRQLDDHLSTRNVPVAIKVTGRIPMLTVRSVPAQEKPFPPLSDVVADETTFELENVDGTLVGFRFPEFFSELNVAGHHFHFLTDDRRVGGHVLGGRFDSVRVDLQYLRDLEMWLPDADGAFDSADLDPEPCAAD